jgi:hypothetical protein
MSHWAILPIIKPTDLVRVIIACSQIGKIAHGVLCIALTNVVCVSFSVGETARPQWVGLDHGERPPWIVLLHYRNKIYIKRVGHL